MTGMTACHVVGPGVTGIERTHGEMARTKGPTPFGTLVKERREAKGLSQEEVADRVGMSQEWTSMVERGRVHQPRIAVLKRLAPVLGVDIEDLVIAVGYATTKTGADRVIPDDIDDPLLEASFLALSELPPHRIKETLKFIEHMKVLSDSEYENNDEET